MAGWLDSLRYETDTPLALNTNLLTSISYDSKSIVQI